MSFVGINDGLCRQYWWFVLSFCRDCTGCIAGISGTTVLLGDVIQNGVFPTLTSVDCCAACTLLPECAAFYHESYYKDNIYRCTLLHTIKSSVQIDIVIDRGDSVTLTIGTMAAWTPPSPPPPPLHPLPPPPSPPPPSRWCLLNLTSAMSSENGALLLLSDWYSRWCWPCHELTTSTLVFQPLSSLCGVVDASMLPW